MLNKLKIGFSGTKWLLLFVFFLQFAIAEAIKVNYSRFFGTNPDSYLIIVCVQLFAVLLPTLFYAAASGFPKETILKLRPISLLTFLKCIVLGVAVQQVAVFINLPIRLLLTNVPFLSQGAIATPQSDLTLIIGIIIIAILPALCEELLMRGAVLASIEKYGPTYAVCICALYFAIMHNNLFEFPGLFFLGFILARVALSADSVLAAIVVHLVNNAFGMAYDYFAYQKNLLPLFFTEIPGRALLAAAALLVLLLLIYTFKVEKPDEPIPKSPRPLRNIPLFLIIIGFFMIQIFNFLKG